MFDFHRETSNINEILKGLANIVHELNLFESRFGQWPSLEFSSTSTTKIQGHLQLHLLKLGVNPSWERIVDAV